MFGMSPWHLAVLVLVGLFVFGPERLPSMIKDLGKALRQVRAAALTMQDDLKSELGPEVGDLDLRSLHPKTFVNKHLFGDEEDPLGLDFLHKDQVSFDKSADHVADSAAVDHAADYATPDEPISAMDAIAEPLTPADLPGGRTRYDFKYDVVYDLDAT